MTIERRLALYALTALLEQAETKDYNQVDKLLIPLRKELHEHLGPIVDLHEIEDATTEFKRICKTLYTQLGFMAEQNIEFDPTLHSKEI
jgi:hypothetical protein